MHKTKSKSKEGLFIYIIWVLLGAVVYTFFLIQHFRFNKIIAIALFIDLLISEHMIYLIALKAKETFKFNLNGLRIKFFISLFLSAFAGYETIFIRRGTIVLIVVSLIFAISWYIWYQYWKKSIRVKNTFVSKNLKNP